MAAQEFQMFFGTGISLGISSTFFPGANNSKLAVEALQEELQMEKEKLRQSHQTQTHVRHGKLRITCGMGKARAEVPKVIQSRPAS